MRLASRPGRVGALGRATLIGVGLACCLLAAGCSSARADRGSTATPATTSGPAEATASPTSPTASAGRMSKIVVIMEENHSRAAVFPSGLPYLWSLARHYGQAAAWSDIGHPSLPNYLAIFGGSAFGNPQDCLPGQGCTYPAPSVFGQAIAKGKTARAYEESMPVPCDLAGSGTYDVNHNRGRTSRARLASAGPTTSRPGR